MVSKGEELKQKGWVDGQRFRKSDDEGGIMISRRPNRRESRENAPGPRKMIAADTISTNAASLASSTFMVDSGNQASRMPALPKPTKKLAIVVRNPMRTKTPAANARMPTTHVPKI